VIDINYLAPEKISWYSRWAPVVNLAPRGLPKFYADVTFNAVTALDMHCPPGISKLTWFRGPEYAVVGSNFIHFREKLESIHPRWDISCVVVCIGGLDHHNLTGSVVNSLCPFHKDLKFKIIVGPYYPHEAKLKRLLIDQGQRFQLLRDPPDIAREIIEAGLGIFGTGVITYEALSVGVPSINIGLTRFHRLIGKELSSLGATVYAGNNEDLDRCPLSNLVLDILSDPAKLEAMRLRGLELVDGRGPQRIVEKIVEMFEKQR
jgi:spore coat polysaccharide biosynthesis predicted glycosyltransferase SpsG